jgi:phage repressor protein C with HTH and peptisase S24 domain
MSGRFGRQVVEEIARRGWNMREASRRTGVSYDIIRELHRRPFSTTSVENAQKLAKALGLGGMLGGVALPGTEADSDQGDMVSVYNVTVSAGDGAMVPGHEEMADRLVFPPGYLRTITGTRPADLAIITVRGDSMLPTLSDNDVVMIDRYRCGPPYEGLFVLRDDAGEGLLVKRISYGSRRGAIMLISDNRAYPPVERRMEDVNIIGKVIWMGVKA